MSRRCVSELWKRRYVDKRRPFGARRDGQSIEDGRKPVYRPRYTRTPEGAISFRVRPSVVIGEPDKVTPVVSQRLAVRMYAAERSREYLRYGGPRVPDTPG